MSHSQFHSTNLFILRHAWLNLWDKHMTTGRINQVTTIRNAWGGASTPCYRLPRGCLHSTGVHQWIRSRLQIQKGKAIITGQPSALERTSKSHNQRPDHLVPRSHKIQAHFSLSSKRQRSWPSVRTTSNRQHLKGTQQSRRIPEWLFDWRVWPSASNPHPSLIASSHNKSKELG